MADLKLKQVSLYRKADGRIPFQKWMHGLKDTKGRQKILARIDRLRLGNFGDHRFVGDGITELKINFGPGYRVYFGQDGERLVILLIGGDKRTQENDIKKAKAFWKNYQAEKNHADR